MPRAAERSAEPITRADLRRLLSLAREDLDSFWVRRPGHPYKRRILCIALCQGAALHYLDGENGVKDFDVYTFFRRHRNHAFPYRRHTQLDFGPSKFGRLGRERRDFEGRHVDLLWKDIPAPPGVDPIEALRSWLPEMDGLEATKQIRERFPQVRVLILSAFDDRDLVLSAVEAGARGYILKDREAGHLAQAVRLVVDGQFVVDPELVGRRPRRVGEHTPMAWLPWPAPEIGRGLRPRQVSWTLPLVHHEAMGRDLPSGTVTFLFTDVESSTKLLHELGADVYAEALAEHRRILREVFGPHGGVEVDTQGDAFLVAFPSANDAVGAAAEAQQALTGSHIRLRMGLHTGQPILTDEGYVGMDVHKGARIAGAAHGGQVVLSRETRYDVGEDFPLTDLGEHRVKDFPDPIWIFQLGSERFPPLKTISNTNLPKPASSFVGREREVSEVASLLRVGNRLVTLTGPGGTGKTRLAIEAAAELVPEHRNGVFWVGLAPIRDPALVSETIGQTLGAKDGLAAHIGERTMLLVLDNFEQVIEAASDLPVLLEACPNLRLLVTSRELLRVRGEVDYPVPPLADAEAVELFWARSRLDADETIAELCRRLDNLPLALELAAARTRVLSPAQILERLSRRLDLLKGGRDAEARQQTLRATIEWSHDLLTAEEQRLFARLSVFPGGCKLETAMQVTDADLDTLQALVDKSLLSHREDRFWMLETIREFAAERLVDSGESDELRRRHVEHFMALAEEAQPGLYGGHPEEWVERLEREHDNLRAALDRLEASGETQLALGLAGATARFWCIRDYIVEGRSRLDSALRADERPTPARARALNAAAVLASNGGDQATARVWAEEALALHHQLGNGWGAAYSVSMLGFIASEEGDFSGAEPLFEESLRAFRDLGDEHYLLLATYNLAWTYEELGSLERARALLEDVLRRARAQSDAFVLAHSLAQLASYARDEGRIQDAISMLKESLRIFRDRSDRGGIALVLPRVARALAVAGRPETAARLLSSAAALGEEIGIGSSEFAKMREEALTTLRTQLDEASLAEAWEQGRALTVDEAVALALDSID